MFWEKEDVIKDALVKRCFVNGFVTSPLLMEILYNGFVTSPLLTVLRRRRMLMRRRRRRMMLGRPCITIGPIPLKKDS